MVFLSLMYFCFAATAIRSITKEKKEKSNGK